MQIKILIFILFIFQFGQCQQIDTTAVDTEEVTHEFLEDSLRGDSMATDVVLNGGAIQHFFEKLQQLEQNKDCKLRIVHIGDSHIQADFFSGEMRSLFQEKFGNGGLGFTFPYNLAKTNGNYFIKYKSSVGFENYRNIYPDTTKPVGLSGIALYNSAKDFAVELSVRDTSYTFSNVKMLMPHNQKCFDLATASKEIVMESVEFKKIVHTIKRGEALSIIAEKYHVSIAAIKKENHLRSNNIQAGKKLIIPTKETETKKISRTEFIPLELIKGKTSCTYYSQEPLDKLYIIPAENQSDFALNGLILEKNTAGIVYSSIGVNGAKASDYNKFSMFFEQIPALEADLFIISLGTNESFDKKETEEYYAQLQQMITKIKAENPGADILLTTPPPSLLKRRYPNALAKDYAALLVEKASEDNFAVWNLYKAMGGNERVSQNSAQGLMAKDKVHYSKAGYEKQGEMFFEALMNTYEQFKLLK
ncbi:peptidoglycan-binding protein [Flavobacterium sediminis]|uniref:Peptidoglycan-binding protein n=1 Tax=Flavobacterium sediminis TaxID=2201181 RepID=A0A2U8QS28_9FLAO|nr:GDSL-type esterase/lipase family protein [Flavobacterium sediminis]AWM12963.1 peptidoglycan-binding protein [Flavobacterium sediminis]